MSWFSRAEKSIVEVVNRSGVTTEVHGVGQLPGPKRIVVDASGSSNLTTTMASYRETGVPHITLVPETKTMLQHIDSDMASTVVSNVPQDPHRKGLVLWVSIAKATYDDLVGADAKWVGEQVSYLAKELNIPVTGFCPFVPAADKTTPAMGLGEWNQFGSVCGSYCVPFAGRRGPGNVENEAFEAALFKAPKPKRTRKKVALEPEPVAEEPEDILITDDEVLGAVFVTELEVEAGEE